MLAAVHSVVVSHVTAAANDDAEFFSQRFGDLLDSIQKGTAANAEQWQFVAVPILAQTFGQLAQPVQEFVNDLRFFVSG